MALINPNTPIDSKTPIEALDFNVRICNRLKRAGIDTVQDLLNTTDDGDLDDIYGLGEKSIQIIREVIDELSWGLKFHTSTTIMESQIYKAAKGFLGREVEEKESWTQAFRTNPHAAAESRMTDILGAKGRINVHISYPDEIIEHDRCLKAEFADDNILPVKYQNNYSNWSELLSREKISLIWISL